MTRYEATQLCSPSPHTPAAAPDSAGFQKPPGTKGPSRGRDPKLPGPEPDTPTWATPGPRQPSVLGALQEQVTQSIQGRGSWVVPPGAPPAPHHKPLGRCP